MAMYAVIASLLVSAVALYAVEADKNDADKVDAAERRRGAVEFVEPPVDDMEDSSAVPSPSPVPIPALPPVEPIGPPDFPRPPDFTPPPSFDYSPPPTRPAGPAFKDGSACGTPSGHDRQGAQRTTTEGSVRATLSVDRCHMYDYHTYDYEPLSFTTAFEAPDAVATEVKVDYGDGGRSTSRWPSSSFGDPCADRPEDRRATDSGTHRYNTPGRYTLAATITYQPCQAGRALGVPKTVTVSMPVFRHSGHRPR